MRFSILLSGFLAFAGIANAQQTAVEPADVQVNNIPRTGLQTTIELEKSFVDKYWAKTLKEQGGKVKTSKGTYTVTNAKIPAISGTPVTIISQVEGTETGTKVWYSIDMGDAYVTKNGDKNTWAAAEKFLQDFATYVHREDVNLQIADAERVLSKTKSEYDRTVREAGDIQSKISKNHAEKALLEQQLAKNAADLEVLQQNVETNQLAQEAAKQEVAKMEEALQLVRAKALAITVEATGPTGQAVNQP